MLPNDVMKEEEEERDFLNKRKKIVVPASGHPYGRMALYVKPDLHKQVKLEATRRDMTLEAYVTDILSRELIIHANRQSDSTNILSTTDEHDG